MRPLLHVRHDGGRSLAKLAEAPKDSVIRAIATATGTPYAVVRDDLDRLLAAAWGRAARVQQVASEGPINRDHGGREIPRSVYDPYLRDLGWVWTSTMQIGDGCKVHLRADELPAGWLLCRISKQLAAVRDGVVYDIEDPTRAGTRCVYGYYAPTERAATAASVSACAMPA